jgi:hypothetical protein
VAGDKLSSTASARLDTLNQYRLAVGRVKKMVTELESNRAGKTQVIQQIGANISRDLTHLRNRALIDNFQMIGDSAGALGVLATRGTGLAMKLRGLNEGLASIEKMFDQYEKQIRDEGKAEVEKEKQEKEARDRALQAQKRASERFEQDKIAAEQRAQEAKAEEEMTARQAHEEAQRRAAIRAQQEAARERQRVAEKEKQEKEKPTPG